MSGATAATVATYVSIAAGLASTAVGVAGAIESSNAQKAQAEYQSDMADYNAKVAEGNAQIAEEEGKQAKKAAYEQSLEKRQEAAQIVGKQRATQAASGVQVDSGSSLDLNLDTVEKGELDAFNIEQQGYWQDYNKRLDAWNARSQGQAQETASQMYSNQAAGTSPLLSAGGTLLSGFSQTADKYYTLTKK